MAQDVYDALPTQELREGLVRINKDGFYSLLYAEMVALLTGAVQEQEASMDELKGTIQKQNEIINELKSTIGIMNSAAQEQAAAVQEIKEILSEQKKNDERVWLGVG